MWIHFRKGFSSRFDAILWTRVWGLRKQPERHQRTRNGTENLQHAKWLKKFLKPYLIDGWALNLKPDAHICQMETKHFRQFNIFHSSSIYFGYHSWKDKSSTRVNLSSFGVIISDRVWNGLNCNINPKKYEWKKLLILWKSDDSRVSFERREISKGCFEGSEGIVDARSLN